VEAIKRWLPGMSDAPQCFIALVFWSSDHLPGVAGLLRMKSSAFLLSSSGPRRKRRRRGEGRRRRRRRFTPRGGDRNGIEDLHCPRPHSIKSVRSRAPLVHVGHLRGSH